MGLLDSIQPYATEIKEPETEDQETEESMRDQSSNHLEMLKRPDSRRCVSDQPVPTLGKIVIFQPGIFDDSQYIADTLKQGNAAVVNYYYTLESTANRIQVFMSGFIYASEGFEEKISTDIVIYVPRHSGIQKCSGQIDLNSTLQITWEK